MRKYTTLLVDDEYSVLKILEKKIMNYCPNLEIVGTFQDSMEAIEKIKSTMPDILFLDIQMPFYDGFQVLEEVGKITSQVIFCTAFSEYALQAIKKSALDYILKPVDTDELVKAVKKAIDKIKENEKNNPQQMLKLLHKVLREEQKISISTQKGIHFVALSDIIHLEGYEGYTKIHLQNKNILISSYSLGKFKDKLNDSFFKCHKSHIINLSFVTAFENEGYIILNKDHRVPISRSYKKSFMEMF